MYFLDRDKSEYPVYVRVFTLNGGRAVVAAGTSRNAIRYPRE